MENSIEIPLSKSKLLFLQVLALGFVGAGSLFTFSPDTIKSPIFSNTLFIQVAGVVSVLIFGICLGAVFKKMFDQKKGLRIDQAGITNNSSATAVGLIAWADVTGVRTVSVFSLRFVLVDVKNPEFYIQKASNKLARKALDSNFKKYGSPIFISANALKCDFKELQSLLITEFTQHKK